MAKDYYSKKAMAHQKIKDFIVGGVKDRKIIYLYVFEQFGFGKKVVDDYIQLLKETDNLSTDI
jgi:hypothetical protein